MLPLSGIHQGVEQSAAPIVVILNASAGSAEALDVRRRLEGVFLSSGFEVRIEVATDGKQILEIARAAVQEGARAVVAAGGDGTVNAVASVVVGTDVPLGIIPAGTLNHFAKDAGIPLDLEEAARTIFNGMVRHVDVGEVNGRIFLNNSSLGIYPEIVTIREYLERLGARRWVGILRATIHGLRRYPLLRVRLNVDGREFHRKTPFVFVGNNVYEMEGLRLGSRESLNAGVLCLCVAHRTGRAGLVRLAWHAIRGKLRESRDFDMLIARSVTAETPVKRLRVAVDGEVQEMEPPLQYSIRDGALRVIVPTAARSESSAA
jgi:diacylglycerol kinase family enzyme